jgi:MFS family permease
MTVTPLAGRLYRRIGPRRTMMLGASGVALATLAFQNVDLETDLWRIRALLLATGWAFGLTIVALQAAAFARIPPAQTGRATAANNSVRQIAASFGVALIATVLTNRLDHHGAVLGDPATRDGALSAFHDAYFVGALLAALGIVASLLVDDRLAAATRSETPRAGVPAEQAPVAQPVSGDD